MSALSLGGGALLIVLALGFVAVPLLGRPRRAASAPGAATAALYREQLAELERDRQAGLLAAGEHEAAAADLKRRMIRELAPQAAEEPEALQRTRPPRWALPVLIGAAMPAAAASLYLLLGTPGALDPAAMSAPAAMSTADMEAMVGGLAARMNKTPGDVRGWTMLGRSYLVLGRPAEAIRAYERALALSPGEVELLTGLAASLRSADPRGSVQRVGELAARALSADPRHPAALAFAGIAAYDLGEYRAAIGHWERLLSLLPPGSELAPPVSERVADARSRLATTPISSR